MAVRATQTVVSKVVTFYKNGDMFFRGYKLAISPQKYRSMETLLNDLTRVLNLPLGARYVLTKTGKAVENLQEFEHGQGYICSSFPKLKNLKYGNGDNLPYWNSSKHTNKDATYKYHVKAEIAPRKRSDSIKPRIIRVIRHGHKPRRSAKVLLNKRTAHTLDQVLDEVTSAIGVWGTNYVRCLYDLTGKRITELSELFKENDCFIAVGNEKLSQSDLEDIVLGIHSRASQKTRLPSINSGEESDVSLSDHNGVTSGQHQPKNRVKLPSISTRGNNESNPTSPRNNGDFKENKLQKQTVKVTSNKVIKESPRNSRNHENAGLNEAKNNHENINDIATQTKKSRRYSPSHTRSDQINKSDVNLDDIYIIGEKIGDGNFAVVRIGTKRDTKEKHALKIIDRKKIAGKEDMLKDEIRIMKACCHENIVKLYDTLEAKFDVCLIMELVIGGDLFDEISNAVKFDEPIASSFTCDIASALDYLHLRNIVHRDIKPENLMVHIPANGKKKLKLADFGLAAEVKCPLFTVCGTPTYVAPEILEERGYGLKVDVWAAGIITYIMLCGFPPFRSLNKDQDELFELILAGDFEFLSPYWDEVSEHAKDFVKKLLVVDPKQRFTSSQILAHHWIQSHSEETLNKETPKPEFNARRKFKGAAIAVAGSNRLFQFKRGEQSLDQRT